MTRFTVLHAYPPDGIRRSRSRAWCMQGISSRVWPTSVRVRGQPASSTTSRQSWS